MHLDTKFVDSKRPFNKLFADKIVIISSELKVTKILSPRPGGHLGILLFPKISLDLCARIYVIDNI